MKRVWIGSAAMGLIATVGAPAQQPPPAQPPPARPVFDETNWRSMLKQRATTFEPLLADIYRLNDAQKAQLKKLLDETTEADIKYASETHEARTLTREQQTKVMREMAQARREKRPDEELKRLETAARELQARFMEIHKGTPWDLEKLAAAIEKTLPPDQAKAGHAEYQKRRPYGLRPVPAPVTQPANPLINPAMPAQPPGPLTPQAAQPTKFRPVARVATAQDLWDKEVEKVASERKYDADQMNKVRIVLTSMKGQADAYRKTKAGAYEDARKIGDPAAREAELKKLDAEVNRIYDELMLRVDGIARADQLPSKVTTMPAVVTKPIAPPQPIRPITPTSTQPGHEGHAHP